MKTKGLSIVDIDRLHRVAEATEHIDRCLFDISDPGASLNRKRRARTWLTYWRAELRRLKAA